MKDMTKLNPCPLCGKDAKIGQYEEGGFIIYCPETEHMLRTTYCANRSDAYDIWNKLKTYGKTKQ